MKNPIKELVINLPDPKKKGKWSEQHAERIKQANSVVMSSDSISEKIENMKSQAVRNTYTIEVYEQVNKLVRFSSKALLALNEYDIAQNEQQETEALKNLNEFSDEFKSLRKEFESVYGKTRVLTKPDNYILDQDHHVHLANQTTSFDWQFYAESLFLKKLDDYLKLIKSAPLEFK